jgi:hypothetical protein
MWDTIQLSNAANVRSLAQKLRKADLPRHRSWSNFSLKRMFKKSRVKSHNLKASKDSQETLYIEEDQSLFFLPWHRTQSLDLGGLSISYFSFHFTKWKVSFIIPHLNHLTRLVLPPCRLWKPSKIFEHLPHLEELDLSHSLGGPDGFFESIIVPVTSFCKNLRKVYFGTSLCLDPSLVHGESLLHLGRSCNLTAFELRITNPAPHIHASVLTSLFRTSKSLQRVYLEKLCCIDYRYFSNICPIMVVRLISG